MNELHLVVFVAAFVMALCGWGCWRFVRISRTKPDTRTRVALQLCAALSLIAAVAAGLVLLIAGTCSGMGRIAG